MSRKKILLLSVAIGVMLVVGSVFLFTAPPVKAQCGSQASSCKNCHETQAQKPVNNDGTTWHTQHAFGDFCYLCHGGNNQAADKTAAHAGMVDPLTDPKANCQSCHPNDYLAKAQIYATTLGVTLGNGSGSAAATTSVQPTATRAPVATQAPAAPSGGAVVQSPDTVDYVQQYNQTVLGETSINWGNVIAGVLAFLLLVGGGALVFWNERRLRKPAAPRAEKTPLSLDPKDYPEEVVALLPRIAALNPIGRKSLQVLLKDPEAASDLLHILSQLDPDIVRRVKSLDRESQALLIALSGD